MKEQLRFWMLSAMQIGQVLCNTLGFNNIGCVSAEQIQASVIVLLSTFTIFVYINQ